MAEPQLVRLEAGEAGAMAHFVASARPPVEIGKQLGAFRDKRYKPGVEAYPEDEERK
jgi:hypothetical protein